MENYVGEIKLFAGDFAPKGWAFCNGSMLTIRNYESLYALLGNTYGGDGVTNFALPNLTERVCIGTGLINSPFGTRYSLAQTGGAMAVTLTANNHPVHNHTLIVSTDNATSPDPTGACLAASNGSDGYSDVEAYAPNNAVKSQTFMDDDAINNSAGFSAAHENRMPYIALNYIIATNGLFPTPD